MIMMMIRRITDAKLSRLLTHTVQMEISLDARLPFADFKGLPCVGWWWRWRLELITWLACLRSLLSVSHVRELLVLVGPGHWPVTFLLLSSVDIFQTNSRIQQTQGNSQSAKVSLICSIHNPMIRNHLFSLLCLIHSPIFLLRPSKDECDNILEV